MDAVPGGPEPDRHLAVPVEDLPARRASRAVLATFALRIVGSVCGLIAAGLLTRELGPDRFGELALIFSVAIIASRVSELGTTHVVAGEMAAHPERRQELAAGLVVLRVAASAVAAAGGMVLVVALVDGAAAEWAGVAVMASVPLAGIGALVVLPQARVRPEVGAVLALGQSVLWLAWVVAAAPIQPSLAAYGAAFLASNVAQAVASWIVVARPEPPAWSGWRPALRWITAHSWPMAVATTLITVYSRIDAVLVFRLSGAAQAGFYSAAYRFLDAFALLPLAMLGVLVPVVARRWTLADRTGVQAIFRLGVVIAVVLGGAVASIGVVAGGPVARSVFGPGFAASGDVLVILALAGLGLGVGHVCAAVLVAVGHVRVVGAVAGVAVVLSVAGDLLAVPSWGADGAAWVTVGVEYTAAAGLFIWMRRRLGFVFPWSRLGRALAAGAVVVAVAAVLPSLPAPALVTVCALAYALAAAGFGAVTADDIRSLAHPYLALGTSEGRP